MCNELTVCPKWRSAHAIVCCALIVLAALRLSAAGMAKIEQREFGKLPDGTTVTLFTLTNASGVEAQLLNYGGILVSLKTPDKNGNLENICLGFDNLDSYLTESPYFGCITGRYANRIAKGEFSLEGKTYTLATNNDANHLHGGEKGFDKVRWSAQEVAETDGVALEMTYLSKDGEEGYPGNLQVTVNFTLTNQNEFKLEFSATTDKTTICNLTYHPYFNLKDAGKSTILEHQLTIYADKYTPIDETSIPTGELPSVSGTPFDFSEPYLIGLRIDQDNPQLKNGLGYDHNWVVNQSKPGELTKAAEVYESTTGRVLEVWSTEPGVQFYSGNFLDGTLTGHGGVKYQQRSGLCLEPQHYPDSPNKPDFPSVTLTPGQTYRNTIVYKFGAR